MAIATTDIDWYLTGAASDGGVQTNPNLSFGGYRAASEITSAAASNIYDDVSGAEASAGDTEYRCICVRNNHATLTLYNPAVYINATTGTTDDTISFAVEVPTGGDTNGTCQTIGGESTSPTVNSGNCANWSTATTKLAGQTLNIGSHDTNLDKSEIIYVWLKRVIGAGAAAVADETWTVAIEGDSPQ